MSAHRFFVGLITVSGREGGGASQTPELGRIRADEYRTAVTFFAQWHPLIVPERSDLRMEYWKKE